MDSLELSSIHSHLRLFSGALGHDSRPDMSSSFIVSSTECVPASTLAKLAMTSNTAMVSLQVERDEEMEPRVFFAFFQRVLVDTVL